MTQLPTLSASKLKTFSTCPYKYKYQYIERLPVLKHPAAALGTAVHTTIDKVCKQRQDPVSLFIAEFNKELHDSNINLPAETRHIMYADGVAMVGDYDYDSWHPLATEVEFRLPFPSESRAICEIHGFIDQMYDWGFVDLKTNKQKPKQEDLDHDLQFILYQWAYKKLTDKYPEQSIWYHLRTQQAIIADVRGKDAYAESVIRQVLAARESGEYEKNRRWHCNYCPFREPCFTEDEVEIA